MLYKPLIGEHLEALVSNRVNEDFKSLAPTIRRMAEKTGVYSNYHTFVRDFKSEANHTFKYCPIVWDGLICLVAADGDVYGCLPIMQQNNKRNRFGNINQKKLSEIWSSEDRSNWLKGMEGSGCPECKYPRMFSSMKKMISEPNSEAINKKDPHWKFL